MAGIFGSLGSWQEGEAMSDIADAQVQGARESRDIYKRGMGDIMGTYSPYRGVGRESVGNLSQFIQELQQPVQHQGQFEYEGQVGDFLSPQMAYEQDQARRALEQSAVKSGGLMSGKMAQELQNQAMNIGRQGYGQAQGLMQQDRMNKFRERQANLDRMNAQNQRRIQNLGGALGQQAQMGQFGTQGMAGAQQFGTQGMANAKQQEWQGIGQRRASGNLGAAGAWNSLGDIEMIGWDWLGGKRGEK